MSAHTRITASAVIIRNQHILLIEHETRRERYFNLPGGGVKRGEILHDALRREVLEETGAYLGEIGRLLIVWEYEPERLENCYGKTPRIGMVFHCTLRAQSEPRPPKNPDARQIGVRWLPLERLGEVLLHPAIGGLIQTALTTEAPAPQIFTVSAPPRKP
jgi:ADP-ribose pyrophosphatase YjhB (NUDIX family)